MHTRYCKNDERGEKTMSKAEVISIVNPNDEHNRTLYVTIKFPDGEVYSGYVEKMTREARNQ